MLAGDDKGAVVRRLTALVAAHQAEDGGWPNADLFHVLEVLARDRTTPRRSPRCGARSRRSLAKQRPDGTFGSTAQQERALIALRAFRWAETCNSPRVR